MTHKPHILLIYTGGTIGMIKDYQTHALRAFDFAKLLDRIPELNQLHCEIDTFSFSEPIDSSNMNVHHYVSIAETIEQNYALFDGFVVLTGSDTMAYTASALSFMFENLEKPVILTGSQLPIGDLRTDAKENLITSIEIACAQKNGRPIIAEVGLYFEYKLYRGNRTTKINAERFEAFTSYNCPPLVESGVHLDFNYEAIRVPKTWGQSLIVRKNLCSNILVLKLFPGITEAMIQHLIAAPLLQGIILETYGSGNAPTAPWFIQLLKETIDRGIHVVNVTQCEGGRIIMGHYETSVGLKEAGVIDGKDITTEAAVAKMMYLLGASETGPDFKGYFEQSLRGEVYE